MKSWPHKSLGEICEFNGGSQPPKSEFSAEPKEGYVRLIQIRDYKSDNKIVYVNEKSVRRFCDADDVMIGRYGPPVFQILRGLEGAYNVALMKAIPDPKWLTRDFLFLRLTSPDIQNYIVGLSQRAAGQTGVNKTALHAFEIPVPPLPEQERIVSILEEAFEGIATATAHAERNLHNARELFQSVLQSTFEQKGEDWVETTLAEVATKIGSGATPRGGQAAYKPEGISLIRSLNVYDREFKSSKLAFIDDEQAEKLKNVIVEEGDVLLNITGASVARCCVAPSEYLPARVNQHVSIIRPKPEMLDSRFLNQLLTSRVYKDMLLGIGDEGGATRQAITKAQIQSFRVALPPLDQQKAIVQKLDALAAETRRLEAVYQRKLDALAELKQSLLQRAFAGEL